MGTRVSALVDGWTAERRPERLVLAFGLLTGALGVVLAVQDFASTPELDYHAYYFTGQAVLDGDPFVGYAITDGTFLTRKAYVYPPVTAPLFVVFGVFPDWRIGYVLNVALLFVVFYLLGRLSVRLVERYGGTLSRVDRWLLVGFCLFSGHSILGMYRGNVDPTILLLLVVGLLAIERGDELEGGTLWGVAALFKLFPAFLGVWLLYRRAYRAVAAAVATGVGFMALGVVLFGVDAQVEFFQFIINERSRDGAFLGGLDPTIQWITLRRPLSHLVALTGNQLLVVSAAILAPFVYLVYRDADGELDRVVAFFATVVAMLISVVPSTANYVVYLFVPLLSLVYLTEDPRAKRLFLAGLVLVNVPLYPQHVELLVGALPLGVVGDAIVAGARTVLTYTSIPLLGFLCLLAGCIRFVRAPDPTTAPADR